MMSKISPANIKSYDNIYKLLDGEITVSVHRSTARITVCGQLAGSETLIRSACWFSVQSSQRTLWCLQVSALAARVDFISFQIK
jgi:hypothetical protein